MSGGGTGGHLFPAIAIAEAFKQRIPEVEFLFVGAKGKIEMIKVPEYGYKIEGLPITGFQRKLTARNLSFPFRLGYSLTKAMSIVRSFKPTLAIGTGGYASGPALKAAEWRGIPTYLQEQNSYPGVTNRLLGKKARKVFTAFETLDKYFPKDKLLLTGNPLRQQVAINSLDRTESVKHFNLDPSKKILFVTGGSLGARTINKAVAKHLATFKAQGIQLIWQCGKMYLDEYKQHESEDVRVLGFVDRMDMAYAAADSLVTRAGASTISEIALIAKPAILIPSPNVAEDHQTKNVMALVEKNAAILLKDVDAEERLGETVNQLINVDEKRKNISENLRIFAKPNAANDIVDYIIKDLKLL